MNYTINKTKALRAVNNLNQELNTLMGYLKTVHARIRSFKADSQLKGRGYDEAKAYFSTYIELLEVMNGICLVIGEKNKTLAARMNTDFTLDETPLESGKLEARIKELEARIDSYECEEIGYGQYGFKLTRTKEVAEKLKSQLSKMESFETETAGMFDEAEEKLKTLKAYIEKMHEVGSFNASEAIFKIVDIKGLEGLEADVEGMLEELRRDKSYGLDRSDMSANLGQMEGLDPVNLANGNYMYRKSVLRIGGIQPMETEIGYNSLDKEKSRVGGTGWTHNYDFGITDHGSHVVVEGRYRSRDVFLAKGEEYEHIRGDIYRRLERSDEGYRYTDESGETLYFDAECRIRSLRTQEGRELRFEHEEGRLCKVYSKHGLWYTFRYEAGADGEKRLTEISDHTGRRVSFKYSVVPNECETEGRSIMLTELRDEEGESYRYGYTSYGELESITNARGTLNLVNSYDMRGRVVSQRFPDSTEIEIEYDDEHRSIRAKEKDGSISEYEHDELYRNTSVRTPSGREERLYDEQGNCILQRDRRGNERRYEYDGRGRLIGETGALGDRYETAYDEDDRVLSMTVNGQVIETHRYEGWTEEHTDGIGRMTKVELNREGLEVKVTRPDGGTVKLRYDASGNLTEITDPLGASERFEYDRLCRLVGYEDACGRRESYSYNQRGELTEVRNAAGDIRRYSYNESGKPISMTDYDGSEERAEYNELNRISVYVDKDGNRTEYGYDSMWNLSEIREPEGRRIIRHYDAEGRLLTETVSGGISVHYSYDGEGNPVRRTDEEGNSTEYSYDAENRLTGVQYADGTEERYTYDAMDNVVMYVDAAGNEWKREYNAAGEVVRQTGPDGAVTSYSYDLNGNVTEEKTGTASTVYEYDLSGRLIRRIEADGTEESWSYAPNGDITGHTVNGVTTAYIYDRLGRVIESRRGGICIARYSYDAVGNIRSTEDGEENRTSYLRSASGDILAVRDPLGNVTRLRYDGCHRLKSIVQGEGEEASAVDMTQLEALEAVRRLNESSGSIRITAYERDIHGRVTAVTDALGNTERYEYDRRGYVRAKTDMEGNRTVITRTVHGDVSSIRYADGRKVEYSYDPMRRLREIKDSLGVTGISRDVMGRETSITDHMGRTVSYDYDQLGNRTGMTCPDGRGIRYEYDERHRLSRIETDDFACVQSYDRYGRLLSRSTGSTETEYAYDDAGRLSELKHREGAKLLDSFRYGYNGNGDLVTSEQVREGLPSESGRLSYGYDPSGRLTEVRKDGIAVRSYSYDAFGNRLTKVENGNAVTYTYNKVNQLITSSDSQAEFEYRYDRRGNLTERLLNGAVINRYCYSAANRLEKAWSEEGREAEYAYNGLGMRVSRRTDRGSTDYILDQTVMYNNLIREITGETARDYIWDNDSLIAWEGKPVLTDRLSTPIRICGENGGVLSYDEFGLPLSGAGSSNGILNTAGAFDGIPGFTGYLRDDISGTWFAQAREYLPESGRFAGRDLLKGQADQPHTLNEYGYCYGDPLRYVDLDGMKPTKREEYIKESLIGVGNNIVTQKIDEKLQIYIDSWNQRETRKIDKKFDHDERTYETKSNNKRLGRSNCAKKKLDKVRKQKNHDIRIKDSKVGLAKGLSKYGPSIALAGIAVYSDYRSDVNAGLSDSKIRTNIGVNIGFAGAGLLIICLPFTPFAATLTGVGILTVNILFSDGIKDCINSLD